VIQSDFEILFDGKQVLVGDGLQDGLAAVQDIQIDLSGFFHGMHKTEGKYVTIPDRREAIRWCIENAQPGDIVVLAGKGHEDYQEIEGVKYPFDERVVIREILESL
jgi:UDP-N-acetylmuramoyl-L-alanyl-D-glutamate--2,6-diaminopimelate ligase